jgi:hypothetical protein
VWIVWCTLCEIPCESDWCKLAKLASHSVLWVDTTDLGNAQLDKDSEQNHESHLSSAHNAFEAAWKERVGPIIVVPFQQVASMSKDDVHQVYKHLLQPLQQDNQ